jgi:hypothetical protein
MTRTYDQALSGMRTGEISAADALKSLIAFVDDSIWLRADGNYDR